MFCSSNLQMIKGCQLASGSSSHQSEKIVKIAISQELGDFSMK